MFELKTNQEIGTYLKKIILSKYPSCRQFCIDYLKLINNSDDLINDDIRKLSNRLSQILKGKKGIQTYDLPIFSELLDVSCEQMLSAGAVCKPISNRKTNYNIAFSTDERDWIEYVNREDCIASYADEFGKTVLDYAIEFKNYGFIRFLIDNGYIKMICEDKGYAGFNFGAQTIFKPNRYEVKTLEDSLYENKILRTQIISLALEKNDCSVLAEMKAREFPPQLMIRPGGLDLVKFEEYYDEQFIETIVSSKKNVIKYFSEEYYVKPQVSNDKYLWVFPFMDKLIEKAVLRNSCNAITFLDASIKHNEETYNVLKKTILFVAKKVKEVIFPKQGFQETIESVLRDFHISKEKNVISFEHYWLLRDIKSILTNIIYVNVKSNNLEIQSRIDKLNELYHQIINIKDHFKKK